MLGPWPAPLYDEDPPHTRGYGRRGYAGGLLEAAGAIGSTVRTPQARLQASHPHTQGRPKDAGARGPAAQLLAAGDKTFDQ